MSARKKYRPRAVMQNPLAAFAPLPKDKRDKLMLFFYTALEEIERGEHPGPDEWRNLADLVNVTETLVFQGKLVRTEVLPHVLVASDEMRSAAERFKAGKGMRMSGPGLRALRSLVDIHEQVLEGFTEREIELAIAETRRIIIGIQRDKKSTVISL